MVSPSKISKASTELRKSEIARKATIKKSESPPKLTESAMKKSLTIKPEFVSFKSETKFELQKMNSV